MPEEEAAAPRTLKQGKTFLTVMSVVLILFVYILFAVHGMDAVTQ
ncbi:hypothetical protein [Paenibacillus agaridevorans]|nr:hypothetical protein [Paenibacillus agaridevorans]